MSRPKTQSARNEARTRRQNRESAKRYRARRRGEAVPRRTGGSVEERLRRAEERKEQEAYIAAGCPKLASPTYRAAWERAVAMGPAGRRAALDALSARLKSEMTSHGYPMERTKWGYQPLPDGSGTVGEPYLAPSQPQWTPAERRRFGAHSEPDPEPSWEEADPDPAQDPTGLGTS